MSIYVITGGTTGIGAATRVTAKNEGMTIGSNSFITGKDSQLNLVIMKGAGATTDKGADYEAYCGTTASTIASVLNGYDITNGYYYIVTKDAYDGGNGNTELKYLFLYVEGDTDANVEDVNNAKTAVEAIATLPAPTTGSDYTEAQIKAEVKKLIEAAAGPNVKVEITTWGAIGLAAGGVDGEIAAGTTVKLTSKNDSTETDTATIGAITIKAKAQSDAEVVTGAQTSVPAAITAAGGVGDTTQDLSTEDAAKTAVKAAVTAALPAGVEVDTSARAFDAGWEFGAFTAPTNGTEGSPAGADGKFASVKVQIKKGEAKGLIEMTNVTVKAKAFESAGEATVSISAEGVATTQTLPTITGTLTASVANGTATAWKWTMQKDSDAATDIANQTAATLDLSAVTISAAGTYKFVAVATVDSKEVSSTAFTLTVEAAKSNDATATATAKNTYAAAGSAADIAEENIVVGSASNGKATITITAPKTPAANDTVVVKITPASKATINDSADPVEITFTYGSDGSWTVTGDGASNKVTVTAEDGTTTIEYTITVTTATDAA